MLTANEVHLADLDAVPVEEITCERCAKVIVTRWEQQVAAGQDFINLTRLRVRILVPVRRALHDYNVHGNPQHLFALLQSDGGLMPSERKWLRSEHHRLGNVRARYAWRRKTARRLGGEPGVAAERAVQAKYPDGIPARLSVERTIVNCPAAMAVARERQDRLIERINTACERKLSRPEYQYDARKILAEALDRLEAEIKEEAGDA